MKKLRTLSLSAVSAAMLLVTGMSAQDGDRLQALAANDSYPTFSLTLSSKSPEYHIGTKMWITIGLTNLTNHDIDCSNTYHYEAEDEDGNVINERHRVPELYAHGCGIGPGGKYSDMEQLNHMFDLNNPGKYKIRVWRREPFIRDEKGEHKVVWSNWITITITG